MVIGKLYKYQIVLGAMDNLIPDNIFNELVLFMKSSARNTIYISRPLFLGWEPQGKISADGGADPKVKDTTTSYSVEGSYLESFGHLLNDKQFKHIRLQNWEFELKFDGNKCKKISILSDYVILLEGKRKEEIRDCSFRVNIAEGDKVYKYPAIKGFLTRLGKRNLVRLSEQVAEQFYSLLSFVKSEREQVKLIQTTIMDEEVKEDDPLTLVNAEGRKLIDKLRSFITRAQVEQFIVNQQLSQEGEAHIKKILETRAAERTGSRVK